MSRSISWTKSKPSTTTSHALLGLLRCKPWTTYELAKQVQRSLGGSGRAPSASSTTSRSASSPPASRPRPTQHDRARDRGPCTRSPRAGRQALRTWLDEPPAPPALEFEAMVKVFFADAGTLAQLRHTLDAVEANARATAARSCER